jgi:hypothetical protein
LSKCGTCIKYRDIKFSRKTTKKEKKEATDALEIHYKFVKMERAASKVYKDKAIQEPTEWMFVAQDGTDQLAYGLPNFYELAKVLFVLAGLLTLQGEANARIRLHLTIDYVAGDNVYIYTHTSRLLMDTVSPVSFLEFNCAEHNAGVLVADVRTL